MNILSTFRKGVYDLLVKQEVAPVHQYLPDDVAELPCLIVAPPSLRDGTAPGTFDLDLTVYVIGRRTNDDDAQRELDLTADRVILSLGGTRGHIGYAVTSSDPQTVPISGQDHPAHAITITTTTATC